ncbi:MAG: hypothetical protein ACRC76_02360 [Proteocatella sp.]
MNKKSKILPLIIIMMFVGSVHFIFATGNSVDYNNEKLEVIESRIDNIEEKFYYEERIKSLELELIYLKNFLNIASSISVLAFIIAFYSICKNVKNNVDEAVAKQISKLTDEQVGYVKEIIEKIRKENKVYSKKIAILSKSKNSNADIKKVLYEFDNVEDYEDIAKIPLKNLIVFKNMDNAYTQDEIRDILNNFNDDKSKIILLNQGRIEGIDNKQNINFANKLDNLKEAIKRSLEGM